MRELNRLGLQPAVLDAGVETREMAFYNRFGQHIHTEARGKFAGYAWPQVSFTAASSSRSYSTLCLSVLGGRHSLWASFCFRRATANRCYGRFRSCGDINTISTTTAEVLIGCDGIRSAVRQTVYPYDDPLKYSGITMWRGVSRVKPFLSGATMAYAGWLETGKVIAYPIEDTLDEDGKQLVNWLCEFLYRLETSGDWSQPGAYKDFAGRVRK